MTINELIEELNKCDDKDIDVCFEETNGAIILAEDSYILHRRDGEIQFVIS